MGLKLLKKNPDDHITRGGSFAPETLEHKGFPDNSARVARISHQAPATARPQLSPYPDGMAGTKDFARLTSEGQTHCGGAKFRIRGIGRTTGGSPEPE
jgi:hypothetical protein